MGRLLFCQVGRITGCRNRMIYELGNKNHPTFRRTPRDSRSTRPSTEPVPRSCHGIRQGSHETPSKVRGSAKSGLAYGHPSEAAQKRRPSVAGPRRGCLVRLECVANASRRLLQRVMTTESECSRRLRTSCRRTSPPLRTGRGELPQRHASVVCVRWRRGGPCRERARSYLQHGSRGRKGSLSSPSGRTPPWRNSRWARKRVPDRAARTSRTIPPQVASGPALSAGTRFRRGVWFTSLLMAVRRRTAPRTLRTRHR